MSDRKYPRGFWETHVEDPVTGVISPAPEAVGGSQGEFEQAITDVERRARENAARCYWDSLSARAQQNYRLAAAAEISSEVR